MLKIKKGIGLFSATVVAGIVVIGHQTGFCGQAIAAETTAVKTVAVVQAQPGDIRHRQSFTAELEPFDDVSLYAKVAGYVKEIDVDIGDRVRKGQVIALLELPEQNAELEKARAADLKARLDLERLEAVARKKPGVIAQEDLDNAGIAVRQADAQLRYANTIVSYGKIVAPFDGVVTKRYVDPGALVQIGTSSSTQATPVVRIAQDTVLRLRFPAPEAVVPDIRRGASVHIKIDATGQTLTAKITRYSNVIEQQTRTMTVEVDIPNPDHRLVPGMFADVSIDFAAENNALELPVQAVMGGDMPTVWVVNAQHKIEARSVTLGLQSANAYQILQGVNAGDWAVFGSRAGLAPGMTVEPKPVMTTASQ